VYRCGHRGNSLRPLCRYDTIVNIGMRSMIAASVSRSDCHANSLCKHGLTDRRFVLGADSLSPRNTALDGGLNPLYWAEERGKLRPLYNTETAYRIVIQVGSPLPKGLQPKQDRRICLGWRLLGSGDPMHIVLDPPNSLTASDGCSMRWKNLLAPWATRESVHERWACMVAWY